MGMRLREGVELGTVLNHRHIDELIELGLIEINASYLRATDQGFLVLNSIIEKLV